ncbi:MAG: hypothetical protein PVG12_07245 [Gammaproteobacteria bacterium]|jgi:hypothetical protein
MNKVSIGVSLILVVFLGNAISEVFIREDHSAQYQRADQMLLAGSGDNPWALPDPREQRGRLPSYITNPKYPTKEDIETKLNHDNKAQQDRRTNTQQQGQVPYGAPGLPQVPQMYAPYSMPYGIQPGYPAYPAYPAYPGYGGLPGMGSPYMGDITGFGGNPLMTPYGNIYGNVVPYQETRPVPDD